MVDKIARLKISADVSEYLAAARQKAAADDQMVASGDRAAQSVERADKLHGRAAGSLERLRREAYGLSYIYEQKLLKAERDWADQVAKHPHLAAEAEKALASLRDRYNERIKSLGDEAAAHSKAAISVGQHAANMRNLRFAMGDFANVAVFSRGDPIAVASNLVDTIPLLLEMRAQYAAAGMGLSGVATAALAAGGAVAGLAAVWGTMAYAADQRAVAVRNLENQLRSVGMADRSLVEQAQTAVGRTGGEIGAYGTTLAAAGKFVGNPYLSTGTASRLIGLVDDYARLNGSSTADAAGQLASMFDGTVGSVDALQRQFRLLDDAALKTARQMAQSGDAAGAYDLMIAKIEERLRNSAGAGERFLNWFDRMWTGFQKFSAADPGSLEEQLATARRNQRWFGGPANDAQVAQLEQAIRERDAKAADARAKAAEFDAQEELRAARQRLDRARQLEGMSPRERQLMEAQWAGEDAARLAGARTGAGQIGRDLLLSQRATEANDAVRQAEQRAAQAEARARAVSQGPAALRLFEDALSARQSLGLAWGEAAPTVTGPGALRVGVSGADKWSTIINAAARETGLDADLIRAVIAQESGGNPKRFSRKGAGGLMQLMPATARMLGVEDVTNPLENVPAGSRYLAEQIQKYGLEGGLAAYNAGPGRYEEHLKRGRPLPKETSEYVPAVLGRMGKGGGEYEAGHPIDVLGQATAAATRARIAEQTAALAEWSRQTQEQIDQTDRLTDALNDQGGSLRDAQVKNEALRQAVALGVETDQAAVKAIEDKVRAQRQSGDQYQAAQSRAGGALVVAQRERMLFARGGDRAALEARAGLENRWQYTGRPDNADEQIAAEEANARRLYQLDREEQLWNGVGDAAASALEQMVMGGGDFRQVLGQLLQDIARLGFRELMSGSDNGLGGIFGGVGKGIGGWIEGLFGGGTSTVTSVAGPTAAGSFFSGTPISFHDGTMPNWPRYHNGRALLQSGEMHIRNGRWSMVGAMRRPVPGIARDEVPANLLPSDIILSRKQVSEMAGWRKFHDGSSVAAGGDNYAFGGPSISISIDARGSEQGVEEKVRAAAFDAATQALAYAYPRMQAQAARNAPGAVRNRVERAGRL